MASGSATKRCSSFSTSGGAACGPPPKRRPPAMAASRQWLRSPAWRRAPTGARPRTWPTTARCRPAGGLRRAARVGRPGGGRRPSVETDPKLRPALEALVEPTARGDPEAPLRWTCKSLRRLADELQAQGPRVSRTLVGTLLHDLGFSLQANAKTREGGRHPDRDAQFAFINAHVTRALAAGEPVISVDTKKKELVGDFKNAGR